MPGGDRINYLDEVATPTAEILTAKLLFNSVISTKDAPFMTMESPTPQNERYLQRNYQRIQFIGKDYERWIDTH